MEIDRKTIEKDEQFLRQISTPVDFKKENLREIINILKDYCISHSCYALAAVQIGIPKRVIYVKNTSQNMDNNVKEGYDEGIIYINPSILSKHGKTVFLEGCASCIYKKNDEIIYYTGILERPYGLFIEYYDIYGNKQTKLIEGFEATVFSHEFDHLEGILHMDKASEIFQMNRDEMREYRLLYPYRVLSKK